MKKLLLFSLPLFVSWSYAAEVETKGLFSRFFVNIRKGFQNNIGKGIRNGKFNNFFDVKKEIKFLQSKPRQAFYVQSYFVGNLKKDRE
jgi:hypothetical protein